MGFEETFPKPKDGWHPDISLVQIYPGRKLQGYGWPNIPDDPAVAAVGDSACLIGLNHDNANCGTVTEVAAEMTPKGTSIQLPLIRPAPSS
ncbi:hypothetical protein [Mycobacteroides abscessus]|uniref:hypothetical protein n=1 Tax=Mycobacteroides abscessus TaxID=36809 RepID=UPI00192880B6|nr:hypothetical protein [Mycobacteroides abscessus]MBL3752297.1 hypothetical protein [Mycobacteroides abscessus subsp. massiliense]